MLFNSAIFLIFGLKNSHYFIKIKKEDKLITSKDKMRVLEDASHPTIAPDRIRGETPAPDNSGYTNRAELMNAKSVADRLKSRGQHTHPLVKAYEAKISRTDRAVWTNK